MTVKQQPQFRLASSDRPVTLTSPASKLQNQVIISFMYSPTPAEEAYALYLLRSVFRRDYADTEFQLDGRSAVPFFTLSGQDRMILRNIWSVADPGNVGTLTDIAQFHTCLRLIALAQCGILGQALAVALPGQAPDAAVGTPAPTVVMAACLQATAPATSVPLPQFAGIEMPPGAALQLIYRESRRHRQRPAAPDQSGSDDSHSQLFLAYQNSQMAGATEDNERTVHTSNLRRTLTEDRQDDLGVSVADVGTADPGPTTRSDIMPATQTMTSVPGFSHFHGPPESEQALAIAGTSPLRTTTEQLEEEDFGDFASTEPTGWDALDALVDVEDVPLPRLETLPKSEPCVSIHDQAAIESEPGPTALASNEGDVSAAMTVSADENPQPIQLPSHSNIHFEIFRLPSTGIALEVPSVHIEPVTSAVGSANDFEGDEDFGDFVDHAPQKGAPPMEPSGILETSKKESTEINGEISSSGTACVENMDIQDVDVGGFVGHSPTELEPPVADLPLSSPVLSGWDALDALAEHTIQVDVSTTTQETTNLSFESTAVNVSASSNLLDISRLEPVDDPDDLQEAPTTNVQSGQGKESDPRAIEASSEAFIGPFGATANVLEPPEATENTQATGMCAGNESHLLAAPYGLERTVSLPVSPSRTFDAFSGGFRPDTIERVSSAPGTSFGWDAFDELTTVQDAPLPTLRDMSTNPQPGPLFTSVQVDYQQIHSGYPGDFGAFDSTVEFQSPSDYLSATAPIIPEGKIDITDSLIVNVSIHTQSIEPSASVESVLSESMIPESDHLGHTSSAENDEQLTMQKIGDSDDGSDDFGDFADHVVVNETDCEAIPPQSYDQERNSVEDDHDVVSSSASAEPISAVKFDSLQTAVYATGSTSQVTINIADSGRDTQNLVQRDASTLETPTEDDDSFGDFDGADLISYIEASAAAQTDTAPSLDVPETEKRMAEQLLEANDVIFVAHQQHTDSDTGFSAACAESDDFEFGDFADFHETPLVEDSRSNDVVELRSQVVSSSLKLPEIILYKDGKEGSEYVDFGDCFDANIGTDQPLDDDRLCRIRRCTQIMQLLSSSHVKLATTYWDQALIVILDELVAGTKLLSDAACLSSDDLVLVVKKIEHYVHGLGEFVRISRSIAATLGDLLMLDRKALLTNDTSASSWCSMTLVQKAIQVECLWSDVEQKSDTFRLSSKQTTEHRLESIIEIRSKPINFDCPLCCFTLRPLGADSASTTSAVVWDGQSFMACTANFLSNRCPFYAVTA